MTCCCGRGVCRTWRAGWICWQGSLRCGSEVFTTGAGVPLAGVAGFVLAATFALGFLSGIELAQAFFLLLLPLAVISYSKLRLALAVRRRGIVGPELVLALARRRLVHQFVAVAAMLAAAAIAIALHPERLPPL